MSKDRPLCGGFLMIIGVESVPLCIHMKHKANYYYTNKMAVVSTAMLIGYDRIPLAIPLQFSRLSNKSTLHWRIIGIGFGMWVRGKAGIVMGFEPSLLPITWEPL